MGISSFWTHCDWTRECPKMRLSKAGSTFPRWPVLARFGPFFGPFFGGFLWTMSRVHFRKAEWAFERFRARFDLGFDPGLTSLGCPIVFDRWWPVPWADRLWIASSPWRPAWRTLWWGF